MYMRYNHRHVLSMDIIKNLFCAFINVTLLYFGKNAHHLTRNDVRFSLSNFYMAHFLDMFRLLPVIVSILVWDCTTGLWKSCNRHFKKSSFILSSLYFWDSGLGIVSLMPWVWVTVLES